MEVCLLMSGVSSSVLALYTSVVNHYTQCVMRLLIIRGSRLSGVVRTPTAKPPISLEAQQQDEGSEAESLPKVEHVQLYGNPSPQTIGHV